MSIHVVHHQSHPVPYQSSIEVPCMGTDTHSNTYCTVGMFIVLRLNPFLWDTQTLINDFWSSPLYVSYIVMLVKLISTATPTSFSFCCSKSDNFPIPRFSSMPLGYQTNQHTDRMPCHPRHKPDRSHSKSDRRSKVCRIGHV